MRYALTRTRLAASAGIVALVAATPALADPVSIVRGWTQNAAGSPLQVSLGDVVHDPASNVTTVTDLAIRFDYGSLVKAFAQQFGATEGPGTPDLTMTYGLTFPEIRFTGLAGENGTITASAVDAATAGIGFAFEAEGQPGQETTGTYSDLALRDLRLVAPPALQDDPERPVSRFLPVLRAAVDFSFAEARIGATLARSVNAEATTIQEFGAMRIGRTERGDISDLELDGMTTRVEAQGGAELARFDIGRVTASNYNYGSLIDILAGTRTTSGRVPVIGDFLMRDLSVSVPGENVSFRMDMMRMGDVTMRTPSMDLFGWADQAFRNTLADPGWEPAEDELIRLVGALYGMFAVGQFELGGMSVTGPELKSGAIGAVGVRDLSDEGLGSMYARGIDFAGTNGEIVRLDDFEIGDIGFPDLQALVGLEKAVEANDIPAILKGLPVFGRYTLSGLRMVIPEEDADLELEGTSLEMTDHIGPIPTRIYSDLRGLKVPVSAIEDEETRAPLEAMGYETLDLSSEMLFRWDEATSDLAADISIDWDEGLSLTADATIGAIPRIVFEQPSQSTAMSLLGATFKSLDARFVDKSIVERGIGLAAGQQGMEPEAMKQIAKATVPALLAQLGDPELVGRASEAVGAVIDRGLPLTLMVSTPTPLPIVAIVTAAQGNPASIASLLEIEITNE